MATPVHDLAHHLKAAREGRDAATLVAALAGLRGGVRHSAETVAEARRALTEAWTPTVRNAAALALLDASDAEVAPRLVSVLGDPTVAPSAGTLLYVLSQARARVPLGILAAIVRDGSFEARAEAVGFLRRGDVEPFHGDEKEAALRAFDDLRDGTERGDHAAMAAAHLARLDGETIRVLAGRNLDPGTLDARLGAAWRSGDAEETRLALHEVREATEYPPQVGDAAGEILRETTDPVLRDAAAAAVAQLDDSRAIGWVLDVLRRPGVPAQSQELVYALEHMGADLPLALFPVLVREAPLHVARTLFEFVERGDVEDFDEAEEADVRRALSALRDGGERGRAAEACLSALSEYRAALDAIH